MYLESLHIKNFRAIKDTKIEFNKGLNILIGPNNSGKTTIIDALRICFSYKDYKSIKVSEDDFYKKGDNINYPDIEFHLSFYPDNNNEKALFIETYNMNTNRLDFSFTFSYNNNLGKVKSKVKGGYTKENSIADEVFEFIQNIYLDALRDAKRYLSPGRNSIISSFFSEIVDEKEKVKLINNLNKSIDACGISEVINKFTDECIEKHFKSMIFKDDEINIAMKSIEQDFDTFTKNWKLMLPVDDSDYLEIHQNGLGYNNLIYMAILLSKCDEISKNDGETIYIPICIEEPEAHLHPQLQNSFFRYLNEINKNMNLQIFITSHSPTLVSKTDLNSLILVENQGNNIITQNLTNLFENKDDLKYLKKFLDVTKSQLLFAKKVLFVEGVTEALLIPVFADIYGFNLDENGVEVVNLSGLSFKRYAPLFSDDNILNIKGVFLTDDDRNLDGKPSDTSKSIMKFKNKNLKVFCSKKTFEYDLIKTNDFNSLILDEFEDKIKSINTLELLDEFFNREPKDRKFDKSGTALALSEKLQNHKNEIIIPEYIRNAFDYLMGKDNG